MGLIGRILGAVFGDGRTIVAETVGVFRENAEGAANRAAKGQERAQGQFAAEFARPPAGGFDRFVDGLNRLPRPVMAFGVLGLIAAAMVDPVWFAQRMIGLSLVPEPLWWLMGAIVSFYFGARTLAQGQDFRRSVVETVARVPEVTTALRDLDALRPTEATTPGTADSGPDAGATLAATGPSDNPALAEWLATQA